MVIDDIGTDNLVHVTWLVSGLSPSLPRVFLSCPWLLTCYPIHSSVALWGLSKKRPLALQREAHGLQGEPGLEQPFWVSSVAALLNTDLVATGGCAEAGRQGSQGGSLQRLLIVPCFQAPTALVCGSGSVARASGSLITSVTSPW